jgi:putative (di)nucleoside polyphosphate hydrolase
MVDDEGYRPNVGIVLANQFGQLLWARRAGQDSWQFPQGGIQAGESPRQAMLRELREEVGLLSHHVDIIACTQGWLHYQLPEHRTEAEVVSVAHESGRQRGLFSSQ